MSHLNAPHLRISRALFPIFYTAICIPLLISACGLLPTSSPTPTTTPVPPSTTPTASQTPTSAPTQTPYVITATPGLGATVPAPQGTFFLSLADTGHYHLFAYASQTLPLVR